MRTFSHFLHKSARIAIVSCTGIVTLIIFQPKMCNAQELAALLNRPTDTCSNPPTELYFTASIPINKSPHLTERMEPLVNAWKQYQSSPIVAEYFEASNVATNGISVGQRSINNIAATLSELGVPESSVWIKRGQTFTPVAGNVTDLRFKVRLFVPGVLATCVMNHNREIIKDFFPFCSMQPDANQHVCMTILSWLSQRTIR